MARRILRIGLRVAGVLVAVAVLAAAVMPFVRPLTPAPGTQSPMSLAEGRGDYAIAAGARLHYLTAGEGEPALVMFHGFGASSASWQTMLPSLSKARRTLAFDRPGFGLTVRPMPPFEGADPYTLQAASDQAVALMDYLGIGKTVLVGHSAGCAVALRVALDHPERVNGLLLEAPAISGHRVPAFARWLMRTPWGRYYGPLAVRRTFPRAGERMLERAFADPDALTPQMREAYLLPLRADDWDRGLWEVSAAAGSDVPGDLSQISVPVTVLFGSKDRIVAPEDSRGVARAIAGAKVVEVPGVGHIPHEERPEAFEAALKDLLRRVATERG